MKRLTMLLLLVALCGSSLWATSGKITTNNASCIIAPAACLVVSLAQDKGGATLTLSGTWTGTIQFEATGDGGTTWSSVLVTPTNSTTAVTSTTGNGTWQVNTAGFTGIRMRASATVTGTAVATITPSSASARSNGGVSLGGGTVTAVTVSSPILSTVNPIVGTGTISLDVVPNTLGGTGQDTSLSTGVPQVSSGTWSVTTGSAGNAVCWKTNSTLSYCDDAVGSNGKCTCH